jgi:23S rRNA (cytidine2498-2'-O)-methyltransferase
LEEALRWPGAGLKADDIAIELGAAPGGAALALLSRGLKVAGVDSGEMEDLVRAHREFRWIRSSAKEALLDPRSKLPNAAQWLLLDIHARGELALKELEPYVQRYRSDLLGAVLTLKLGNWKMAELIPRWLEKVRAMGFASVRAKQLPSNRQEFCVVAMTAAGLKRR